MATTTLDRRKFLKHAGMGTVVLAGAPVLAGMGASPAMADEEHGIGFFFAALDSAGAVHNPTSPDALLMQGCGHFDDHSGHISGNGFFVHYDGNSPLSPKPIKATGLWEARRLVSFDPGSGVRRSVDRHHGGQCKTLPPIARAGSSHPRPAHRGV
jgi:hypothetical protein